MKQKPSASPVPEPWGPGSPSFARVLAFEHGKLSAGKIPEIMEHQGFLRGRDQRGMAPVVAPGRVLHLGWEAGQSVARAGAY